MTPLRCPRCEKWFDPSHSKALPFCSDRCRLIDLGRWLNEDYRVPGRPLDEDEESEDSSGAAAADDE